MIQLLFLVLFAEGIVALLLMVKIGPLRELVMKGLDQVKMGKGPATVKTIAGTMSVILLSSVTSILKIQNKGAKLGTMTPMDQVLWRTHLLETSLMERAQLKEKEEQASKEIKLLQEQISTLTQDLKKLKLEAEEKDKKVETAEAHVVSLQKQAADLLLEYDRLLEDNQNLQTQALGFRG
ncbi:hypothetical protein AAG906_038894 [Vitis piasezkii]